VVDAATVLVDTSGVKTIAAVATLAAGRYLMTFFPNVSLTLRAMSGGLLSGILQAVGSAPYYRSLYLASLSTTALPVSGAGRLQTASETDSNGFFYTCFLKWSF
jgi:glucose uptake protein GlcU